MFALAGSWSMLILMGASPPTSDSVRWRFFSFGWSEWQPDGHRDPQGLSIEKLGRTIQIRILRTCRMQRRPRCKTYSGHELPHTCRPGGGNHRVLRFTAGDEMMSPSIEYAGHPVFMLSSFRAGSLGTVSVAVPSPARCNHSASWKLRKQTLAKASSL